jgi:hypothetical protein
VDGPILEVAAAAEEMIARGATTWQKFTCAHCGSRQTMAEPNTFYLQGDCEECGKRTDIDQCGYLMVMTKDPGLAEKIIDLQREGGSL